MSYTVNSNGVVEASFTVDNEDDIYGHMELKLHDLQTSTIEDITRHIDNLKGAIQDIIATYEL